MLRLLCKVDYESDKFINAPTYTYDEVMRLLELVGMQSVSSCASVGCDYMYKDVNK